MDFSAVLLVLTVLVALIGVAHMIAIASYLQSRGYSINWVFLKLFIFKYIGQYRDLTRRETGRTGRLYYGFVIAMNTTLVMGLVAIAVLA